MEIPIYHTHKQQTNILVHYPKSNVSKEPFINHQEYTWFLSTMPFALMAF